MDFLLICTPPHQTPRKQWDKESLGWGVYHILLFSRVWVVLVVVVHVSVHVHGGGGVHTEINHWLTLSTVGSRIQTEPFCLHGNEPFNQ